MRFLLPLMLALAACWASDPNTFGDVPPQLTQDDQDSYRLPLGNVEPTEYDITLEPSFESSEKVKNFTFNGKSEITLNFKILTNTITFHAKNLKFDEDKTKLTYYKSVDNKTETLNAKFKYDKQKDFVTLTLNDTVPTKTAKLFLQYTGNLVKDEFRGFYRSSYQNKEGKQTWLATTHFEPVSAREAFPCWDEPKVKAQFTINIKVPQIDKYHAISNMAVKTNNNKITIFNKTPKMSTYLVAFVISDFTALQNENKNFNIWAKPTVEEDPKKFALNYGSRVLEELKKFTNIDYYASEQGMTKMDQIVIPDISTGAMENWGLVTYREPGLLIYTEKTSTAKKQSVATLIAHELSHQWFGNLVTCEWWDYIWLNEGFATFFQYYIADKVIPQMDKDENWRLMEQFVVKNVQAQSFVVDASSKSRPLNPKKSVQTPTQIHNLFDDIAYKKGASILHMMKGFLSEEVFQEGIRNYLNKKKGSFVNSEIFFEHVQKSNKKVEEYLPKDVSLNDVMDNWVKEPGYPVITVAWEEKISGVNITQERFFLVKPTIEDKTKWYIPINYVTEESPDEIMPAEKKSRWMIPGSNTLIEKLDNKKWILFNKDQTGYYRVNYHDSNWELLSTYLKTPYYANISATNRAQLIDDALNLAHSGRLAYKIALQMTSYLSSETDYIPWYAAVRAFNDLDSVLLRGKIHWKYHKYVADKIINFATTVNFKDWENGTHVDKLAKVMALNTACKYGLKDCEDFASKKFKDWLNKKEKEEEKDLSADMKRGILCAGLRNADAETFNKTLKKYESTEDKDEKADLLAGLGCAKTWENSRVFLERTLEKNPNDIFAVINSICTGKAESFDVLTEFINNNTKKIHEVDKENNSLYIAVLNNLSKRIVTAEQYVELSLLMGQKQLQETQIEAMAIAANKLEWIKTYQKEIEDWIEANCDACRKGNSASSITLTSLLLAITLLLTRFY